MNNRIRYTLDEIQRNVYYQMPKFLFEGELEKLTNDARVLYSLLRDRFDLSIKNHWINENGEVYLIFSRENMCEALKLSRPTVTKAMNELRKYELVDEKRLGQGRPNRIYLLMVDSILTYKKPPQTLENTETEKFFPSKNEDEISGEKSFLFQKESYFLSEGKNFFLHEGKNLSPNENELKENYGSDIKSNPITSNRIVKSNETDIKTDTIRHDMTYTHTESEKRQKNKKSSSFDHKESKLEKTTNICIVSEVEEIVKENINYEHILIDNHNDPSYREMLDGVVHVIVSTIVTDFKDGYISMGNENIPAEAVKSVFFKLTKEEIEYFIENFNRQIDPTIKLAPYIRASLFRNHGMNNFYWTNRAHVDMPHIAEKKLHKRKNE